MRVRQLDLTVGKINQHPFLIVVRNCEIAIERQALVERLEGERLDLANQNPSDIVFVKTLGRLRFDIQLVTLNG